MSEHGRTNAGAILRSAGDLGMRYARVWVVAAGFMAAVTTVLDIALAGSGEALANILGSILSFFVSYHVVEAILRGESLQATSSRSYGSLFGASILTSLGIGFAFVALIVPGIYCMARWSLVTPLIVAEGRGMMDAMSESWARTKDSVWSLAGVYAIYFAAIVALIAVAGTAGILEGASGEAEIGVGTMGWIMPFVVNLASVAIGMVGNLIGIAVYRALADSAARYGDVFG